jgi:SAM-dependent methyltransferase
MKQVKDLFSTQAATYAAYRPVYPQELYNFLFSVTPAFHHAWDCGTGNGQVASQLAKRFDKVAATDISTSQMQYAPAIGNITYDVMRAEQTAFPDRSFDLITVGTALHWFDFDGFYREVERVARPGAALVSWAYATCKADAEITAVIEDFYHRVVGKYWDAERKFVDEAYRTIPFPFRELPVPRLSIEVDWTKDQLIGYLNSWSSVQHYIRAHNTNPVSQIERPLNLAWGLQDRRHFSFPLCMRAGRL